MTIDRAGMADLIQNVQRVATPAVRPPELPIDSVAVSAEAVGRAEFFREAEMVHSASDVRADRIAEVRAKLAEPGWIDARVLGTTADRIADQFLGDRFSGG